MTTAEQLRSRLEADLRVAHIARNAERPGGLTASAVGGCSQFAARTLIGAPKGQSDDFWRALRGTYIHDGLADDLNLVDPEFTDGRAERFTWSPGGGLPDITGAADFRLGTVMCEVKTRDRDECRWHADHGPDPQHAVQVAQAAVALQVPEAAVIYLPTNAGWEEASVHMIDVRHWITEAVHWLDRVDVRADYQRLIDKGVPPDRARERVLADVPREPHVGWCQMFCEFYRDCRGDYVAPADLEIADPTIRAAMQEAEHWRQIRLHAEKKEDAAKSRLRNAEGNAPTPDGGELTLRQQHVADKPGRRGHTKIVVKRRPG